MESRNYKTTATGELTLFHRYNNIFYTEASSLIHHIVHQTSIKVLEHSQKGNACKCHRRLPSSAAAEFEGRNNPNPFKYTVMNESNAIET